MRNPDWSYRRTESWNIKVLLMFMLCLVSVYSRFPGEERREMGSLEGDVQNWAMLIQNYILQLASDGINRDDSQSYLDQANYTVARRDGEDTVHQVKEGLGEYFKKKKQAAQRLAKKMQEIYDEFLNKTVEVGRLSDLNGTVYLDSDIPKRLPNDLTFIPYFKQEVSWNHSTIKIADEVPRDDNITISSVIYTAGLDEVFKQNRKEDNVIRWQYFGSTAGIVRIYPGREWSTNFAGFYNDYDPRLRPWYIAATSGPKDVVIILDCRFGVGIEFLLANNLGVFECVSANPVNSYTEVGQEKIVTKDFDFKLFNIDVEILSLRGEKFTIAQGVAKTVINTLTKQDYVNVICARASHWDQVGKWKPFQTSVLSCQENNMVPATTAHRKDLIEKIDKLKPGGTSELEKGFEKAYELLKSVPRTGCQSLIIFATDGKDTDGENTRCGPGYYTRSGYVPGPVCRYNWTKVWSIADNADKYLSPQPRIFSYLIKEEAEHFPGKLACEHQGSMKKLITGENLISQMSNYFDFLSSNAKSTKALWTSPYLDAWGLGIMVTHAIPVISKVTEKTIGVVGVDATLDEIENFLTKHQWGSVYSFLINKEGETIYHPKLKPSTNLLEDPIFIPISQLEQDKDGKPEEFQTIHTDMREGKAGSLRIEKAKDGQPRTYHYAALNESEYSFAYSLANTDLVFRRSQEPTDRSHYTTSYFNLLKEYTSPLLMKAFPGAAEYLDIRENESKYPGLRISHKHSTIFLPPKAHCDPTGYIYDDNLTQKTLDAHRWINSYEPDLGCESHKQKFHKGIRADVLITQPIEKIWRDREFESLRQIKWTNIGLRSGVFRTYPGHRSTRGYDPTKRPWYKRTSSAPWKTSISTPYMDAAGVGKIVTISQAVFEGMPAKTDEECFNITGPRPGGCTCDIDEDCISKSCYLSKAPGPNSDHRRCATERVEGVTGLDILYDDFQNKTMGSMEASDFKKSCGQKYVCPDGEPGCETRCYLFDNGAYLVMDPDFLKAEALDKSGYYQVQLGTKEGEVMKDLIYKHKFFVRKEDIDFQGSCRITPEEPKVTLDGIPKNPEEKDEYYKNKGPIPKFHSEFGCIQDVVSFSARDSVLGPSRMITGNVTGPCMSGFYYVTSLPKTNLYLLVIEDWNPYKGTLFYNFNCRITRSIVNAGAYRIINGTCEDKAVYQGTLAAEDKCPKLRDIQLKCTYTTGTSHVISDILLIYTLMFNFTWINYMKK